MKQAKTLVMLKTALVVLFFGYTAPALAGDYEIVIKDHRFIPDVLEIPANKKVKLVIHNQDPTPEEFESYELNREKIIRGGGKGIIFVGPLEPGEYPFFGEFNEATAQGKLLVK